MEFRYSYLKHFIVVVELVSEAKNAPAVVQVVINNVTVVSFSTLYTKSILSVLGTAEVEFLRRCHAILITKVPSVPIPTDEQKAIRLLTVDYEAAS